MTKFNPSPRRSTFGDYFYKKRLLREKEEEVRQRKESLGYAHIDPKQTKRHAKLELKTGRVIPLRGEGGII